MPRAYDSTRRRQQAEATRLAILHAARRLFERDGYPATTVEEIAAEAGVALKTVYSAFGTKSGLLRALWDLLLKGDTGDAPVAQRAAYLEVMAEPDPERQLRLNAANARVVKERIGAMFGVIRSAATVDAEGAELWALIQRDFHANQRTIVDSIAAKGALRDGLTVEQAADVLWALNHPDLWLLLVGERGWTPAAFEAWLADGSVEQLLGSPATASRGGGTTRRGRPTRSSRARAT